VTAIGDSCFADRVGPWEAIMARAFTPDAEFPRVPIQIIQGEGRHFTRPSAEPGHQEEHRGIALPWWCRPLTARQQVRDVLGVHQLGQG
jgi:hypothetical protein